MQRPNPVTPLYRAPYFNVDAGGSICRGNVAIPQSTTLERIKAWNEAFTCSFFTHPNGGDPMVKYPGGPYRFWCDMLDGKYRRFPERVLLDLQTTLGDLLGLKG